MITRPSIIHRSRLVWAVLFAGVLLLSMSPGARAGEVQVYADLPHAGRIILSRGSDVGVVCAEFQFEAPLPTGGFLVRVYPGEVQIVNGEPVGPNAAPIITTSLGGGTVTRCFGGIDPALAAQLFDHPDQFTGWASWSQIGGEGGCIPFFDCGSETWGAFQFLGGPPATGGGAEGGAGQLPDTATSDGAPARSGKVIGLLLLGSAAAFIGLRSRRHPA